MMFSISAMLSPVPRKSTASWKNAECPASAGAARHFWMAASRLRPIVLSLCGSLLDQQFAHPPQLRADGRRHWLLHWFGDVSRRAGPVLYRALVSDPR
jgi:hypothetical protein